MINLIIVLLVVHFIVVLSSNKRYNVLGCGLLGFSGQYAADKDKLALLYLYNEKRGEHSAGYYNHNRSLSPGLRIIKKGNKVSENLLTEGELGVSNLFIGHTRAATSGTGITLAINAHPFLFGKWVAAHNGTLKNLKGLIREYDMDEEEINLDSKIFAASMNKNENFKVLSHYEGAAALLWANVEEVKKPKLYAYHDKERPLFRGIIKKGSKIGMYLSSIENSLIAIGCEEIEEFDEDTIYEIESGIITNTLKISRSNPIKNEVKRIPESFLLKCRKEIRGTYSGTPEDPNYKLIKTFDDGTLEVSYPNCKEARKVTKEEVIYDPEREITVHTKYINDGGFEEVKVATKQGSQKNTIIDNTVALEDVMDYIVDVYNKLDETRAKLSVALDGTGVTEADLEGMDDVMVNVSKFVGTLAEIAEIED